LVIAVVAGICLAGLFAVAAVIFMPVLAVAPLLLFLMGGLLINDRLRMAFVVFGGLLTLQTSQEVTSIKLIYLAGVCVALAGATLQVLRFESEVTVPLLRPLLAGSLLFLLLIAGSFFIALAHDTDPTAWLRDSAPYFLFASVPIFALDLSQSRHRGSLVLMFVLAGVLSAMSFTVSWLDRRHIAELAFTRLVLPSLLLPLATWCYAVAKVVYGKGNQLGWIAIVLLVPALLLATGGRSGLVLLAAPVGMVLASKGRAVKRSLRLLLLIVAAGLCAFLLVWGIGELTGPESQVIAARFTSISQVLVSPERDPSYLERVSEASAAWNAFAGEPFFGTGPGHAFIWHSSGLVISSFNIDNAISFPAKFGAIGLAVLLVIAVGYASFVRRLSRSGVESAKLALVGFLAILLAYLPLAAPFEDKGFSFALLFLLVLGLGELASRGRSAFGRLEQPRASSFLHSTARLDSGGGLNATNRSVLSEPEDV